MKHIVHVDKAVKELNLIASFDYILNTQLYGNKIIEEACLWRNEPA